MPKPRILIVEDEPIVAMELQETLEPAGYEICGTIDGADDLLAAVQEKSPHLILMDIRLRSFLDGIDAVQRLRLFNKIPVVYMTAWNTQDVRKRADATEPAAFLTKPIDPDELLKVVVQVLGKNTP